MDSVLRRVLNIIPGAKPAVFALDKRNMKHAAEMLAAHSARLYGGAWVAQIDQETGVILIRPRSRPEASA